MERNMISTRHMLAMAAVAALAAGPLCAGANTGTITHIAGTLSAKKPDGTTRVLSPRAEVGSGDTISTERDSHAQIRFADGGEVTLKPETSFKIENFSFSKEKPKADSFATSLLKGGFRFVTGILGSRSRNKVSVGTATATIGIRGTTFSAHDCLASACGQLKPGVYVGVSNGSVVVRNPAGQLRLAAGQFGIIEKGQRPRVTPNPGLSISPPQAFSRPAPPGGKPSECVVR